MPDLPTLFLGIDPGNSGGIALISPDLSFVQAYPMPDTEADVLEIIGEHASRIQIAMIERVHAFPKIGKEGTRSGGQGVSSAFEFGRSYGFLRGILVALRIPFEDIPPQTWQKQLDVLIRQAEVTRTEKKNFLKSKAQQLFPMVKRITHATADALLLAETARRRSLGVR